MVLKRRLNPGSLAGGESAAPGNRARRFHLLVDTCVWLDLVKDGRQSPILTALEGLVAASALVLVVPDVVRREFQSNKRRVVDEARKGAATILNRARRIVAEQDDNRRHRRIRADLASLEAELPRRAATTAPAVVKRIEALFEHSALVPTTDGLLLKAAQRAVMRAAPFHRQRNGVEDAVLIEIYAELVASKRMRGARYGFVTHNTKDFSSPYDARLPHPDLAPLFSPVRSLYFTNLGAGLRRLAPEAVSESIVVDEIRLLPRTVLELERAETELFEKVWYDRHQLLMQRAASKKAAGRSSSAPSAKGAHPGERAAKKIEKRYGRENLGPWTDFDWGFLNGKLSAIRWALGDEWDILDT
jgi:hypothetical protein